MIGLKSDKITALWLNDRLTFQLFQLSYKKFIGCWGGDSDSNNKLTNWGGVKIWYLLTERGQNADIINEWLLTGIGHIIDLHS